MQRRPVPALLGLAAAAAIPLLAAPAPAHADWHRWGWRHRVVIAPPFVVAPPAYGAPPPAYDAPYARPRAYLRWIPPHRDWRGYFVPGHWA